MKLLFIRNSEKFQYVVITMILYKRLNLDVIKMPKILLNMKDRYRYAHTRIFNRYENFS